MKVEKSSIITSIIFFLIGLVLYIDFNGVINFVSYALGTFIAALGAFKLWGHYRKKLYGEITDYNEFGFGLVDVILGVLIIVLAEAFTTILRLFVGGWVLFAGINRLVQSLSMEEKNSKFVSLLIMALLVVSGGVYIILDKNSLDFIGLIMMIYAVIEIIACVFYKEKVIIAEDDIIEATIVEEPSKKKNKKR